MNKLSGQFIQAGLRDMALEFLDHDRGGTEELIAGCAGRLTFVSFELPVPPLQFERDAGCIPIFQRKEGSQGIHGCTNDNAFPGGAAGMRIDRFAQENLRPHDFIVRCRSVMAGRQV